MDAKNPEIGGKNAAKRPTVVTIAAILLIVLSLFVAGLGIASQFGLLGRGFGAQQFIVRNGQNRNLNIPGGVPQGRFPQGGFPQGGFPNDQNNPGSTQNFTPNRQVGTGIFRLFRLIQPVTIALDIILLVLSIIAAIGLFKTKRWAAILAIVLAGLVILLSLPGFIRIFAPIILVENLLRILMAAAVIVLLLLPSARKSFSTPIADEPLEVERIVR
jgi:hypothetical protein